MPRIFARRSLLIVPLVILPPVLSLVLPVVIVDRSRALSLRPERLFAAGTFARRI
jgi:hypothetical protein